MLFIFHLIHSLLWMMLFETMIWKNDKILPRQIKKIKYV